jgi:hypothetical protein
MKSYPSIPKDIPTSEFVAFGKLDGSNIRAEWSPKKGFYKFGTRTKLIDASTPVFGKAINLILALQPKLDPILKNLKVESVVTYWEFLGLNSFAGQHDPNDEHQVVLIDVDRYKKGFIPPLEFISLFQNIVPIPPVLFTGEFNPEFHDQVLNGTLPNMPFEGVICKLTTQPRIYTQYKIKNKAWIQKVHSMYGHDPALLNQIL